jgi:3-phosphoshikimate 1-carboxyvinyltransferase
MAAVQSIRRETSQDMAATIDCLQALLSPANEPAELNCSESGSTLRFLVPVAAALGREAVFSGTGRLAERPLDEYIGILTGKGVTLDFAAAGHSLPLTVRGKLQSGEFHVPGHISSQYITGLMLALPLLDEDSAIYLTSPLQSAPYVEITQSVLAQFGAKVKTLYAESGSVTGWSVPGNQRYRIPSSGIKVEADYSQAAFWLVAQFLGQQVEVSGLNPNSVQGDRAIIQLLAGLSARENGENREINAEQIPDLVPALAVAACHVPGRTVIGNAKRLRLKESDRLQAIADGLSHIGATITAGADCLVIEGGVPLLGGGAEAHNDHRIAMALAIAALGTQKGVHIRGANAVNKSYPNFFAELKRLGGDVHGLDMG